MPQPESTPEDSTVRQLAGPKIDQLRDCRHGHWNVFCDLQPGLPGVPMLLSHHAPSHIEKWITPSTSTPHTSPMATSFTISTKPQSGSLKPAHV